MTRDVLANLEATWDGCRHDASRYIRVHGQRWLHDLVCSGCGADLGRWVFQQGDERPRRTSR